MVYVSIHYWNDSILNIFLSPQSFISCEKCSYYALLNCVVQSNSRNSVYNPSNPSPTSYLAILLSILILSIDCRFIHLSIHFYYVSIYQFVIIIGHKNINVERLSILGLFPPKPFPHIRHGGKHFHTPTISKRKTMSVGINSLKIFPHWSIGTPSSS